MSKRCKMVIMMIISAIGIAILALVIKLLFFSGMFVPLLKVKGDDPLKLEVNEQYEDPGVIASFHFQDYSDEIQVENHVDIKKKGTYTIVYKSKKYNKEVTRKVEVVDTKAPETNHYECLRMVRIKNQDLRQLINVMEISQKKSR